MLAPARLDGDRVLEFDEKPAIAKGCINGGFFVLNRRVFVCNSPDTVAQAFIAMHSSFERKSPQMRNALSPLIGDGLFVSDGATWKQRRRMVVPVVHVSRLPVNI